LQSNTIATLNTAVGYLALNKNTDGAPNTAIGYTALAANTSGGGNTAVGFDTLTVSNNAGTNANTAVGSSTLRFCTGINNTALGYRTGFIQTSGNNNTLLGYLAASSLTTGSNNIVIGSSAAASSATASNEIVMGDSSITSFKCRVLSVLSDSTTPTRNVLIGSGVGQPTQAGNVFIGFNTGADVTTGGQNTMIGQFAGNVLTTGNDNTFFGYQTGLAQSGGTTRNTLIGSLAGSTITTGSNVTCLGYLAAPSAVTVSNEITLGNTSILATNGLRCMSTTIISASDIRDKKNVNNLDAGLDFINNVRPVRFLWNMREGGTNVDIEDTGFIAQELKQAQIDTNINIPGLVVENNPDRLEAGYAKLLPILVKAVQELSQQVKELKTTVTKQQATIDSLLNK
jgi:hypothetical protein